MVLRQHEPAMQVQSATITALRLPAFPIASRRFNFEGPLSELVLREVDRYRHAVFSLLAVALIAGFNGLWRIQPDSGLYLALGKNIALGRGYMYRGEAQHLAYPGLPCALSVLYRLFPSHYIVAADGLIFLCSIAALLLTYRLCLLALDRPTAVLVTFGLGLAHLFFRYTYEILTDMPFLAAVMAVLAAHERIFGASAFKSPPRNLALHWLLLIAGLVVGMSLRPTMLAFLAAYLLAIGGIAVRRRQWLSTGAGGVLALAVFALFILFDPRQTSGHFFNGVYEQSALHAFKSAFNGHLDALSMNLQDLLGLTAARSVMGMPLGLTWLNVIFGLAILASGIALIRVRLLWGLWISSTLLMLLFVISLDRYMLQILPLLILGWWRALRYLCIRLPKPWGNLAFSVLLVAGVALNIIQVCNMVLRQHDHPFYNKYRDGRFAGLVETASMVPSFSAPEDVVVVPTEFSRPMTFLSGRRAYEPLDREVPGTHPNVLVVLDPSDVAYTSWLSGIGIVLDSPPLSLSSRGKGKSPLELVRAHRSPAP